MNMRVGTWPGALGLVNSEIQKDRMDLAGVLYFIGKIILIISYKPGFLFIGELSQQLKF